MDTVSSFSKAAAPQEASSHCDELLMQQSMIFSQSLMDLKNLRKQLYSAAEYFEQSYSKEEQKLLVFDNLKDYAVKALINTVDHLGSVAYKIESLLDERVGKIPVSELRLACLEQFENEKNDFTLQRIHTCQEFIDREARFQQSWVITAPTHHKRYILPVFLSDGETIRPVRRSTQEFENCNVYGKNESNQIKNGTPYYDSAAKFDRAVTKGTPAPVPRQRRFSSPLLHSSPGPEPFSFSRNTSAKEHEKQRMSMMHFPVMRSGSVVSRTPSPSSYNVKRRYPSEPRRSVSQFARVTNDRQIEREQYASKSKRIFKALLGMRRPKKDGTLHKYLDQN